MPRECPRLDLAVRVRLDRVGCDLPDRGSAMTVAIDRHRDSLMLPHPDDECVQCERCGHWACDHWKYDHPLDPSDECQALGCECAGVVIEGDCCVMCGGSGEVAREPIPRDPQLVEFVECPLCEGDGDYRHSALEETLSVSAD